MAGTAGNIQCVPLGACQLNNIKLNADYRPPDKSTYLNIIFLISEAKHMLWVLKRTVSIRGFF